MLFFVFLLIIWDSLYFSYPFSNVSTFFIYVI
jgi:hypothetical protein